MAGRGAFDPPWRPMRSRGRHSPGRHLVAPGVLTRLKRLALVTPVALIALALLVVGIPLAVGSEWRTVQTGSMRPYVSPGDVVLVTPSDEEPQVGDIIAFRDPIRADRDVLHRIAGIADDGALITKGDANDVADPWRLDRSAVIGSQTFTIPKIGFVVGAMSSDVGILLFLVLPALVIIVSEGRVWVRYVRQGAEAFETAETGRHLPARGKHLTETAT